MTAVGRLHLLTTWVTIILLLYQELLCCCQPGQQSQLTQPWLVTSLNTAAGNGHHLRCLVSLSMHLRSHLTLYPTRLESTQLPVLFTLHAGVCETPLKPEMRCTHQQPQEV